MPSTAWNVFVASGVAIVVYFAARMGQVLLGLAAGTILFLGGWLTGYAINHDLLDSLGLLRIGVAGTVSAFVVFWTVVVEEGAFLTGMIVMGLVWFAAWFTSEMGPIKGERGAMATIDEPKPPEGPRPGTPVNLGGDADATPDTADSSGVLGKLRGVITPSAPEPPAGGESDAPDAEGPSPDDLTEHGDGREEPTYTTREVDPNDAPSGGKESIFGLGIFYEGDPEGTPAGAETDGAEPSATEREPKGGDHTRPGASEPRPESDGGEADETDEEPIEVEVDDDPADDGDDTDPTESRDDPPEEHRVDVEDSGFIFD